jgi:thiol-disulfide isomerase/thioredoxin
MKKTLFTILSILVSLNAISQATFTLSGDIKSGQDLKISLYYLNQQEKWEVDSTALVNGKFNFQGKISSPEIAFLTLYTGNFQHKPDDDTNKVSFFLEPGIIHITGTSGQLKKAIFSGSKSQKEYNSLLAQYGSITTEYNAVSHEFDAVNDQLNSAKKEHKEQKILDSLSNKLQALHEQYEVIEPKYLVADSRFITTHTGSYVSAFVLSLDHLRWPVDTVRKFYKSLNADMQKSIYAREVRGWIDEIADNSAGQKAKDLTTTDINGKSFDLSNLKGKYVLLDFWASWCVPCRQGTPHMLSLFKQYSNSGLDIVAISVDKDKDAWVKAVNKDDILTWHNVLADSDKTGSTDARFGVHVFPTKILIDPAGMIIGRYTGIEDTDALDKKLAEVFK